MTDQKALALTNLEKIEALAQNQRVISSFIQVMGSKRQAYSFISSALLAVSASSDLMECEPASIWSSALRVATLRLSCEPSLAQAHLVAFKNWKTQKKEATVILGWRGIKQIAMRTNKYRFINSRELYEGQTWDEDQLTGLSTIGGKRTTNKIIGYFNFFELFNGYSHGLYMTVDELQAHGEKYSKTYNFKTNGQYTSKWRTDFHNMALKTVTRLNLLRNGYMNPEDAAVIDAMAEDASEAEGDVIDTTFQDIEITEGPHPEPEREIDPSLKGLSQEEILNNLGYDGDAPKKKQEDPTEKPWTSTKISLEMAKTEKASTGELYWEMPTEDLANRFNTIDAAIKKNGMTQDKKDAMTLKRDVAQAIMDHRAAPQELF